MARRKPSRGWTIVIAFFLGASISALAFDFSDFAFYNASASGSLSATQQPFWFAFFPGLFYLGFFLGAYLLGRSGLVKPVVLLYFYIFLLMLSVFFGLQLPQSSDKFYSFTVLLGTVVSGGIILGVIRQVKRGR